MCVLARMCVCPDSSAFSHLAIFIAVVLTLIFDAGVASLLSDFPLKSLKVSVVFLGVSVSASLAAVVLSFILNCISAWVIVICRISLAIACKSRVVLCDTGCGYWRCCLVVAFLSYKFKLHMVPPRTCFSLAPAAYLVSYSMQRLDSPAGILWQRGRFC